jgi:uncharacterized membrane protein YgdD (TMEM256/DUF423 family)
VLIANKYKTIFAYCAFLAGLSVLLGAFGAHTLSKYISPYKLDVFNKASSYLMSHSLAVVLLLLLKNTTNLRIELWTVYSMFFGVIIFSLSLYLVSISELQSLQALKYFGAIAPIGGTLMIAAWFATFFYILKTK